MPEATSTRQIIGVAVAALMLAGCTNFTKFAERAQIELVGSTKADILACAGVPQGSAIEGGLEFWTYSRVSVIGRASLDCKATFVLDQGTVRELRYTGGRTGRLTDPLGECGKIVKACLQ